MGSIRLLFDSNILILALEQQPPRSIRELLESSEPVISRIAWIEVLVGRPGESESRLRAFLRRFRVEEITPEISERAVEVRRTNRLKLPDALIYATALETGRTLVTLNSRDFPPGTEAVLIPSAD